MQMILTRKAAFKMSWHIFRMATGSHRVGIIIKEGTGVEIVGSDLISKENNNG